MSDHDDEQMPRDPFRSHDAERIAKETGGQITGSVVWEDVTRLTIGAIDRGIWPNLVGIRLYDHKGKPAGAINLGANDVDEMLRGLHQAMEICWPAPPDPAPEPRTNWDAPWQDDDEDQDDED